MNKYGFNQEPAMRTAPILHKKLWEKLLKYLGPFEGVSPPMLRLLIPVGVQNPFFFSLVL